MEMLQLLWKPILVSAALVFVASSILWMALPIHKHDYKNPGDKEDAILGAVRSASLAPGVYYVPWCQGAKAKDPAVMEKMKSGPWAMLTVMPHAPHMGRMLFLWFLHLAMVGVFVAYICANAGLAPGARYLAVFRVAGVSAFIAHTGYALPMCIWHGTPWNQLPGRVFDGAVYALLTAGTFAWLWPELIPSVTP